MVQKQLTQLSLVPHGSSLVQVMACRLFGAKPSPEPMLAYCQLDSWLHISVKFELGLYFSIELKFSRNGGQFVEGR